MKAGAIAAHRATDLRYRFLSGRVSLEPMRILRCREIEAHGWAIKLVILGASHAVVLERPERIVTELLTCMPPVVNAGREGHFERAIPSRGRTYVLPTGLGVDASAVTLESFPLHLGDGFKGGFEFDCQLDLDFPRLGDKVLSADLPRTRIGWQVSENGLAIETIHTYPEDAVGIRSRTVLSLASPKRVGER